jgi:hypothetical protein
MIAAAAWALSQWRLILGAVLLAAVAAGSYWQGRQGVLADWNAERAAVAQEQVSDAHWRAQRMQEVQDAALIERQRLAADALAAAGAAAGLRQQLATLRARHPGPAGGGTPAGDAIGVLADVLERADTRARILAAFADESRAAGLACESAYESMRAMRP